MKYTGQTSYILCLLATLSFNDCLPDTPIDQEYVKLADALQLLEHQPNNIEIISRIGNLYRDMDKYEESVPYFRKAVELQPNNVQSILELAHTLNMIEETDEALKLCQSILDINPNIQEALYNYGFTLKKTGDWKSVMHEVVQALLELVGNVTPPISHSTDQSASIDSCADLIDKLTQISIHPHKK